MALVLTTLLVWLNLPVFTANTSMQGQHSQSSSLWFAEQSRWHCGFDPQGADEAINNHLLNQKLLNHETMNLSATGFPQAQVQGNIAVIEDDGSLILPPNKFDLNNSSLLFTPDSNAYRLTPGDFSFRKDYGTQIIDFLGVDDVSLDNANNGYYRLSLVGKPFTFFGVSYDELFIGTNGYVTFEQGDTTGRISAAALASEMPRIAPLWADLDVTENGGIYVNQLSDSLLITWNKAPQAQYSGPSTFQLLLFNDGRIAFVYKKVKARNALVGLSPGHAGADAQLIHFSAVQSEQISRPICESFSKQKRLDIPAVTRAFYSIQPDAFDTVFLWTDFDFDNGPGYATSFNVRNDIRGIGIRQFDKGAAYGSAARLSSISVMGDILHNWPDDPNANIVGLFSAVAIVCHEQGHRWLAYVRFKNGNNVKDDLLGRDLNHWSFLLNTQSASDGNFSSIMEGNIWNETASSSFRSSETAANYFSELDQYLMGLRSPDEVSDLYYLDIAEPLKSSLRITSPATNIALSADKKQVSIRQIIAQEGERVPDSSIAPKNFRSAFILLTERGAQAAPETVARAEHYRSNLERYFSLANSRRGSLDTSLSH
jgi:hypothetical protein